MFTGQLNSYHQNPLLSRAIVYCSQSVLILVGWKSFIWMIVWEHGINLIKSWDSHKPMYSGCEIEAFSCIVQDLFADLWWMGILLFFSKADTFCDIRFILLDKEALLKWGQTPTEKEDKLEIDEFCFPTKYTHSHCTQKTLISLFRCIYNIQTAFTSALSDQNLCSYS